MRRVTALIAKDLAELRHSPGIFVPAVLTGLATVAYPFIIAIVIPSLAGDPPSESSGFESQSFIFQHALVLMVGLTTVTGSMSVAAHSVIGEKQARTLEPLLATPLRTAELLAAKVIGAAIPGFLLMAICFAIYLIAVALWAEPGVWLSLLTLRTLSLVFATGPLAALLGLQLAVCASSRVNDPRSAQQYGAILIIVPIAALQIAQFVGGVVLTAPIIAAVAVALAAANAILFRVGIAIFDREAILTRWK